ncbi:9403_t:CDS:2, partial [Funneliformis caledonium]
AKEALIMFFPTIVIHPYSTFKTIPKVVQDSKESVKGHTEFILVVHVEQHMVFVDILNSYPKLPNEQMTSLGEEYLHPKENSIS